jgi:hypothetical protein
VRAFTINGANSDAFASKLNSKGFLTAAPTITAISPNSGPTGGGTSVTITGTYFVSGIMVTIGGTAATNVTFVSATSITATTPPGTPGVKDIVVTNPDTQTGTLTSGFTFVAFPTITSISPYSGPIAGGILVSITGTYFASGATVTIGGKAATNVTVVSATLLTATTPSCAAGANDVAVTTPDVEPLDLEQVEHWGLGVHLVRNDLDLSLLPLPFGLLATVPVNGVARQV